MIATTISEAAIERALGLLTAAVRERAVEHDGFLDLLPEDIAVAGAAQRMMRWRSISRIYSRWWRPAWGRLAKGVLGPGMADEHRIARLLLGLGPGDGVLDVACGPGNFSREFARGVGDEGLVVGLDASPVMLAQGVRETHAAGIGNLAFARASASELPFHDASFDGVCCFAALHLFDAPFDALGEMRRVLTPGGRIAIFTSCQSKSPLLRRYEGLITRASGIRLFAQDEITAALERLGFTDIEQRLSGVTQYVGGRLPASSGYEAASAGAA